MTIMGVYNKAGVAALSGALITIISSFVSLDPEVMAAIQTLATVLVVWAVPNKALRAVDGSQ